MNSKMSKLYDNLKLNTMAECGNCSEELKFANTSLLGGGKLASQQLLEILKKLNA